MREGRESGSHEVVFRGRHESPDVFSFYGTTFLLLLRPDPLFTSIKTNKMSQLRFDGHTVVITGARGGIGRV